MRSKALIIVTAFTLLVSVSGLLLFVLDGGFGGRGYGMGGEIPRPLWLVLFVVPLLVAFSILGYSLVFPDLSIKKPRQTTSHPIIKKDESALNAVLRVLNNDERRVIETLLNEGGIMLQKDIRWKTGFSRVKTHRILFRLTKRGIVSAEKHYNTNKIALAEWLMKKDR